MPRSGPDGAPPPQVRRLGGENETLDLTSVLTSAPKGTSYFHASLRISPTGGVWAVELRDAGGPRAPVVQHVVTVSLVASGPKRLPALLRWLARNRKTIAAQARKLEARKSGMKPKRG